MLKLNLASGGCNREGFVNIDKNPKTKPDLVLDIVKNRFPYEDSSVDEVWFTHGPEHIERRFWDSLFMEIKRVLKPNGKFILGYPEWTFCAKKYMEAMEVNDGQKDFWLQTMYGRRFWEGDEHVTAVNSPELQLFLESTGFYRIKFDKESSEDPYNSLMVAYKDPDPQCREKLLCDEMGLGEAVSIQTVACEKFE